MKTVSTMRATTILRKYWREPWTFKGENGLIVHRRVRPIHILDIDWAGFALAEANERRKI